MSELSLAINRPDFSAIRIDDIEALLDEHLAHCREVIAQVATVQSPSWDNLMQPQEEAHNALNLFWSPIGHLNAVMNNEALREVYKRCLPKRSAYYTELGQNRDLYNATLTLRDSAAFDALSAAQQQAVHNDIRDFELGGVSLNDADKKRFGDIALDLSRLSTEFSDNVLDATNAWEKQIDDVSKLKGLPESAIAAAAQRAQEKGFAGWHLNLEFPVYHAVMTFADDRSLREELYRAFCTRASDQGPHAGQFDNSARIAQILRLRAEKARLLGFDNFAELSVVPKMVETPEQVVGFLNDMAQRSVAAARQEFDDLANFARDELGIDTLQAWDAGYAADKLKQKRFALSDEDLKPYFPANRAADNARRWSRCLPS